jgi:hypothetical protein
MWRRAGPASLVMNMAPVCFRNSKSAKTTSNTSYAVLGERGPSFSNPNSELLLPFVADILCSPSLAIILQFSLEMAA